MYKYNIITILDIIYFLLIQAYLISIFAALSYFLSREAYRLHQNTDLDDAISA